MKNEFNITKFKDATVYTLESATSGGTSAGSVASVSSPMGGVRRRGDNLIAQEEKKEAPKPRNFVAKNAKMGGAGQHKDKKKEQKQGNEKHKKPYMEDHEVSMASNELKSIHGDAKKLLMLVQRYGENGDLEAWQQSKITKAADYLNSVLQSIGGEQGMAEGDRPFRGVGGAFNRGDDERHDLDPTDWYVVKDGKMFKTSVYPNQVQLAIAQGYSRTREEAKAKAEQQGVEEGGASMPGDQYLSIPADQTKLSIGQQMAQDGITYSPDKEDELIGLMSQYMKKAGMSSKQIRYYLSYDEDFIPDQLSDLPRQGVAEGSGANKTYLAMAYLKAVVMAPMGTPEKRRILNWQQILSNQFDIEMNPATLAQLLPQFDNQLKSGQLDKLQNRMASRGELEIGESEQGVAEGAVKELSSDLKTMSDEEFQSRYKMSKADARANLKKKDEGSYYESLSNKLAEKLNPNAPTDVWVKDFQKADPSKYRQFKNKTPAKKAQMAVAAHYAANEPSKKK